MNKTYEPSAKIAFGQAWASLRHRPGRQALTCLGIALGTAFVTSVLAMRLKGGPAEETDRLTWLGATSLGMCIVGVANSMLMSVAERFREIGAIKCLGATDRFVVSTFLFEAAMVGGTGSIVGAGLGLLAAVIGQGSIPTSAMAIAFGGGVGLGVALTVLAALAPAVQAAKMPAAAALRVEV